MKQEIIEKYLAGDGIRKIQKDLNLPGRTIIERTLQENGIPLRTQKKMDLMEDKILPLYKLGWNSKKISKYLNVSYPTMVVKCRKLGLDFKNRVYPDRPEDDLVRFLRMEKLEELEPLEVLEGCEYSADENFFDTIDSEYKAYLLGMWYADGNVYVNEKNWKWSINLGSRDLEIVETAKNLLRFNGPILVKTSKNGKKFYTLSITRKKMANKLIEKGCPPKKSLILEFPSEEIVPNHLIHHFIRGWFDGDGSIFISKGRYGAGLVGTEDMINGVLNKCPIDGYLDIKNPEKNTHIYQFTNHSELKKFINFIYEDCTLGLRRKALKSNNCLKHIYEYGLKMDSELPNNS